MAKFEENLRIIEETAASGSLREAEAGLRDLLTGHVPRPLLERTARVLRKTSQWKTAIRLLNQAFRTVGRAKAEATDGERLELALCLASIGFSNEAIEVAAKIDANANPAALMCHAQALMAEWRYAEAIPVLERYLARAERGSAGLGEAEVAQARMHLARALTYCRRHELAAPHFEAVFRIASPEHQAYYFRFSKVYQAMGLVAQGRHKEAALLLGGLARYVPEADPLFRLHHGMWTEINSLYLEANPEAPMARLFRVKDELVEREIWDFAREVDVQRAYFLDRPQPLLHLFFGTPHAALREEVAERLGGGSAIPESYEWNIPRAESHSGRILARDGSNSYGRGHLKEGQALHRLFRVLCSDFYQPVRLPSLYSGVYPGEYFNPVSSPDRARKLAERLREWLGKARVPLDVEGGPNDSYRLFSEKGCTIVVEKALLGKVAVEVPVKRQITLLMDRLRERFGGRPFSAREAASALDISDRSAVRHLKAAREAGLDATGAGPSKRYRFKKAA